MPPRLSQLLAVLGHRRARYLPVAGCLVICVVLAAAMTWYVITSRHGVISDAVREMRNDSLMIAEDQDRLLQTVDECNVA